MAKHLIYPIGSGSACRYASAFLEQAGLALVDHPTPEVTHLLLDVPSKEWAEKTLEMLPHYITVIGGNLNQPALEGYRKLDLLQDEGYLSKNAMITAECALQAAAPLLTTTLYRTSVLIIGWGRIGKCLGNLLKAMGSDVTIAARKPADRAILEALGYKACQLSDPLTRYRLIFNTAPELILTKSRLDQCRNCVKIDLASRDGLEGDDVVRARGLPGIYAPESSGQLIAETILRLLKEEP